MSRSELPPSFAILDGGWGDGGKAKAVACLAQQHPGAITVRFQGGNNSGHTVVNDGRKVISKVVPVGCTLPDHVGVIAPYTLVMPLSMDVVGDGAIAQRIGLPDEVAQLRAIGLEIGSHNLVVDPRCNLVLPWHTTIEAGNEQGATKIGSTRSGIGPGYMFLHAKYGVRVGDCFQRASLERALGRVNTFLRQFRTCDGIDARAQVEELLGFGEWVCENTTVRDVPQFLETRFDLGSPLIYEGAQGFGLDVIQGTVPFSTSSFTCLPEVAGWVPPNLERVLLRKAYETRVGAGPFPSRILDETVHDRLRRAGNEYGASTGRPRDCGWLDAVVSRAAVRGIRATSMFVTKLDVLAGFKPRACTGYLLPEPGRQVEDWPTDPWTLEGATASSESMPDFEQGFLGAKARDELPEGALDYLHRMEQLIGVRARWLSTGPESNAVVEYPLSPL